MKKEAMKKRFNQKELFTQGLKGCPKCEEIKPLDEFGNDKTKTDGKNSSCRDCHNASARKRTESISDAYAKRLILKQFPIFKKYPITEEMIADRKMQIQFRRMLREFNKKIVNKKAMGE